MLSWQGQRVLNTRPFGQHAALSQMIRNQGGIPIECPALLIEPVDFDEPDDWALMDKVIFTSTNAVHYCFDRLQARSLQWPESVHVIAIGQATQRALQQQGIQVTDMPTNASSEDLLCLTSLQQVEHQKIRIVKGEKGREVLADTLQHRGAEVMTLTVYRRLLPWVHQAHFQSLWRDDAVDVIVFTSEEAMRNVFQLLGGKAHVWLQNKPCIVKSERLALAATALGMQSISIRINI